MEKGQLITIALWVMGIFLSLIFGLVGLIYRNLGSKIDKMNTQTLSQNTDQYAKIHKQNDEIANLRAHMAEKFMMKDDYDRLERKKK